MEQLQEIFAEEDDGPPWNVQRMIIDLNDPAIGHRIRLNFAHLNDGDRFYVFKKRPDSDFSTFDSFLQGIPKDLKAEIKHWKKYLGIKYTKRGKGKDAESTSGVDIFREEGLVASPAKRYRSNSRPILTKEQDLEQRITFIGERESDLRTPKSETPKNPLEPNKKKIPEKGSKAKGSKAKTPKDPPKFWEMLDDD